MTEPVVDIPSELFGGESQYRYRSEVDQMRLIGILLTGGAIIDEKYAKDRCVLKP